MGGGNLGFGISCISKPCVQRAILVSLAETEGFAWRFRAALLKEEDQEGSGDPWFGQP